MGALGLPAPPSALALLPAAARLHRGPVGEHLASAGTGAGVRGRHRTAYDAWAIHCMP